MKKDSQLHCKSRRLFRCVLLLVCCTVSFWVAEDSKDDRCKSFINPQLLPRASSHALVQGRMSKSSPALDTLRAGVADDAGWITSRILSMAMNPLGLDPKNFLVIEEGGTSKAFGQVRRLPGGGEASELASLFVEPEARGQGLGTSLVRALVLRHAEQDGMKAPLYVLTLNTTVPFFEANGFNMVSDLKHLPPALRFESTIGSVLARIVTGVDLAVLELDSQSTANM